MNKLEVFLDSNEYKRCGHNFASTPMRKIIELASKDSIQLLITTVVLGEVSHHIQDDVTIFVDTQKNLAQNAASIRNLPEYADVIRKIDAGDVRCKAQKAFSDYLAATKCRILSSNEINNDSLLNDYFSKKLPFENNNKKNAEFKDAFIVYTLRKYADENDAIIHIVSSDKGFCGSFAGDRRFRIFSRSEELFSFITRIIELIPAENAQAVQLYISQPDVNLEITTRIKDEIYSTGVWVEDADDGDIFSVDVSDIALLYLDDLEDSTLPIHIEASVRLVVDYTCIDEANSYWDKEEGAYLFMTSSDVRLTKNLYLDFNATLDVEFDEEGKILKVISLENFEIEDAKSGIKIEIDDDDDIEVLHSSLEDHLEEEYVPGAYNTCPDCSCKINYSNDGGNGFCIKCAPNH